MADRVFHWMPRYFFHFHCGDSTSADLVGRELAHDEAAKSEAAKLAADVSLPGAIEGELPAYEWVEIVDEWQRPIARLPVADAFREPNRTV